MSTVPTSQNVSRLPDADMQAAPLALARAAQRARDIARQTGTPLVFVRDGVVVEEYVADAQTAEEGDGVAG
jgi:hypothetical protein